MIYSDDLVAAGQFKYLIEKNIKSRNLNTEFKCRMNGINFSVVERVVSGDMMDCKEQDLHKLVQSLFPVGSMSYNRGKMYISRMYPFQPPRRIEKPRYINRVFP